MLVLVFLSLIGLPLDCSNPPAAPHNPTATPTPSGPYIIAAIEVNGAFNLANVMVSDSTGNSGTANTSVTLTTGGTSEPLTTLGTMMTNSSAETIEGVPLVSGYEFSGPLTYSAGQTYVFSVVVGGATYSASVTGLAGNPLISPSSGSAGVTCSWAASVGNKVYINLTSGGLPNFDYIGPPLSSNPFVISNSYFYNETPGTGSDTVNLLVAQVTTGAFPGAQTSSCVISRDNSNTNY